jgi:hypothetical protein
MFHETCVYGSAFESVVEKSNIAVPGRDRVSHPVILDSDVLEGRRLTELALNLIFLGNSIKYLPYFYTALRNGEESGVLRERTPYRIESVLVDDEPLLDSTGNLSMDDIKNDVWECQAGNTNRTKHKILVELITPLRLKVRGEYTAKFGAADFILALHRRTRILCAAYGSMEDDVVDYGYSSKWEIKNAFLIWRDFKHYSSRQKSAMQLGGVLGKMTLEGEFSRYEIALLKAAELFHAGKNASFGLGKLRLWGEGVLEK